MGYRNTPNNDAPNLDLSENPILNCYADTIDRYYVHDDRYGQYLSIQADKTELVCSVDSDPKLLGYHISKYDSDDSEIFVPQLVIAGFDSKIRVKYTDIENILESFYSLICSLFKSEKIDLWNTDKLEAIDLLDSNSAETLIQILSNPNWDIELLSNQNFRNQLREKKGLEKDYFFNSNLGGKERDILIKNLPKHIWRIRLRTSSGNGFQVQTDLLFDATEIMQGNIFIGYLSYTKASLLLWEGLKSSFNRDDWYQEASQDEESSFSKCNSINRKLRSSSDNLDKLFGVCRLPRRNLKDSELENGNPVQQNHIMVIPNDQTKNWETIAETSSPYIWVIDEFGHLVIGNEIIGTDEWKQGHPTLINYKLARIGGELRYNKETTSWTINTKSGAYSRHLWDKELQQIYLDKVKRLRFNNFPHDLSIDISDFEPT
jgi:hypothetical protein